MLHQTPDGTCAQDQVRPVAGTRYHACAGLSQSGDQAALQATLEVDGLKNNDYHMHSPLSLACNQPYSSPTLCAHGSELSTVEITVLHVFKRAIKPSCIVLPCNQ